MRQDMDTEAQAQPSLYIWKPQVPEPCLPPPQLQESSGLDPRDPQWKEASILQSNGHRLERIME